MNQLSTIVLILIVFLQTFSRFVVEADYFLNKSYITKVLCINKDKPKMNCKGKCYLTRQLKEQDKQEQQAPNPKKEKFEVQPFFLPKTVDFTNVQFSTLIEYHNEDDSHISTSPHSVFHPPAI